MKGKYFLLFILSSAQWTFLHVFVMQPSEQSYKSTHTYSSTVKAEDNSHGKSHHLSAENNIEASGRNERIFKQSGFLLPKDNEHKTNGGM